jgi:pimeloyl-ACP methyl ester carboxylesterase
MLWNLFVRPATRNKDLALPLVIAILLALVVLTTGDHQVSADTAPGKDGSAEQVLKGGKEPKGSDTPLDVTIPGSPISVVARPSGSYGVYRNSIKQFYGGYAEGVYLWVRSASGSTAVWGPEQVPAGRNPNRYTQTSHTLAGTGTVANPWVVTTLLGVGNTGLQITQRVTYVNGQNYIRNDWSMCNSGATPYANMHLFHAADLYTNGDDRGYGYYDPESGAIGGYTQDRTQFQIFIPINGRANHYEENGYATIWQDIGDTAGPGTGFRDIYFPPPAPANYFDNGAGLEWTIDELGGGSCTSRADFLSFTSSPQDTQITTQGDDWFSIDVSSDQNFTTDMKIGRYYGPVGTDGHIAPSALNTTVDSQAKLSVQVSNVNLPVTLSINGHSITIPAGSGPQAFVQNIDTSWLVLPRAKGQNGNPPVGNNTIQITHQPGSTARIGEIRLELRGMRPLVLVGGINLGLTSPDHDLFPTYDPPYSYWNIGLWHNPVPYDNFVFSPLQDRHNSIAGGGAQLGQQIEKAKLEYGVSKVNVLAHSMGGLWAREYVLRGDSRASVDNLLMLGTPNAGSIEADALHGTYIACMGNPYNLGCAAFLYWYNRVSPAIQNLTAAYMRSYNETHGQGSCPHYYDLAAETRIGNVVLPHDFAVSTSSVQALSYSEHRSPVIVQWHIGDPTPHSSEVQTQPFQTALKSLYERNNNHYYRYVYCTGDTRPLAPNQPVAPAETSWPPQTGVVAADETKTAAIIVDGADTVSFELRWLNYATTTLQLTLVDPLGTPITPDSSYQGETFVGVPGTLIYTIKDPRPGSWQAKVLGQSVPSGDQEAYFLGGNMSGGVQLVAGVDRSSVPVGQSVGIIGTLQDGTAVSGSTVTASVVLLTDNTFIGEVPLTAQAGGEYRGAITLPRVGTYSISVHASGTDNHARLFSKIAQTQAQANSGAYLTGAYRESVHDPGGTGVYDTLTISTTSSIAQGGQYRLAGELTTSDGRTIAYASDVYTLTAGTYEMPLTFQGTQIGAVGADGPYKLQDLYFSQIVTDELRIDYVAVAYGTASYSRYNWPREDVIQIAEATAAGVDTDHDTLYDYLEVSIPLDIRNGDAYSASLRLAGAAGETITSLSVSNVTMQQGTNNLVISFPGSPIRTTGVDGPFSAQDLSLWRSNETTYYFPLVLPRTSAFRSIDFEGAPCPLVFSDLVPGDTFYTYAQCLSCRSILGGYADGTFRPGADVTRGQLSKIVANAAGFNDTPSGQTFADVSPGSTFYLYVERMASRGVISGYPCGGVGEPCGEDNLPYFRANNNATRGQISKIISNAAGFSAPAGAQRFADVAPGSTFYDCVQRLASQGVMSGYPCGGSGEPCGPGNLPYFRPGNNATRGQTSKIVANTFFPNCQNPNRR